MLRNSNRTRLSSLVEICQLAEVLEHAIAKVLQAADDHGRSRHRIHFRCDKTRGAQRGLLGQRAARASRQDHCGGVPLSR
jgi:hypothetical protein